MAEVVLKLTGDTSDAESDLTRTANTLVGVGNIAKKTSSDIKKGFDDVANAAKKANDEISNPKPTENQKRVLNATQQLKKEIKEYEAAALKAGEGTKEFAAAIAAAGKKKADLKDLKEAIAALDPDAVAKTFLGLASSVAGGFTVAQSAIALTGSKSEELEKTLLKVQAAQGLLAGLQQLANTSDELSKVKIIALNKLNTLQINLQAAAESKNIVVKKAATIAQYTLNAAMQLGGSGVFILIGGIATLVTVISRLIPTTESATEKQERLNKEFEKTKELTSALISTQDSYIELLKEQGAGQDELDKAREVSLKLRKNQFEEEKRVNEESLRAFEDQLKEQLEKQQKNDYLSLREDIKTTKEKISELKNRGKVLILQDAENSIKSQIQVEKDAKERASKEKQAFDKRVQLEKDFQDALKSLRDKSRAAEIQGLTGSERIEAERKINQDSIDELVKYLNEKAKLANKELTQEQLNQINILRVQSDKDANDKLLKQRRDFIDKEREDAEQVNQEAIEAAKKLIDEQQKALEEADKARILLTKEGSKERLDAEIDAIEKERDFIIQNTQLTSDQRIIIEQEALQKIADLQKEFADKNPSSLAKLLGVTDKELEVLKTGLNKAGDEIKKFVDDQFSAQNQLLDNELKNNEESIKAKDDKIKTLEGQLNDELELQRQGLANNVDAIREAIANEQNAKQAALDNEKRIKEEKKKLAIAQLAIDSATQVSDLVTASTEIYKALAILGPVGIGLAIGTIGLMIGSFLSAKAKAVQAINSGFKDGGYTGDLGETEVAGSVHGREFVSTAKTTKKHRALLEALHKEDYSHLTIKDLAPLLEGTGVTLNKDVLKDIKTDQAIHLQRKSNEPREMIDLMKKTNKNIGQFFDHYKNKPSVIKNSDGSETIWMGNTKRTIRKK